MPTTTTSNPSVSELQAEIDGLRNKSKDAISISLSEIEDLREKKRICNEKVATLQNKLSLITDLTDNDAKTTVQTKDDGKNKGITWKEGIKGPFSDKQRQSQVKFSFCHSIHVFNDNDKKQSPQKYNTVKRLAGETCAKTEKNKVTRKSIFRRHTIGGFNDLPVEKDKSMNESELIKLIAFAIEKNKKIVESLTTDLKWKDITHFLLEKQKRNQQINIDSLELEICELLESHDDIAHLENTKAMASVVVKQIEQKRMSFEMEIEESKQQTAMLKMLINGKAEEDLKRYGEGYENESVGLLNEIRRETSTGTKCLNKANLMSNGSNNFLKSCHSIISTDKKDVVVEMKSHLSKLDEMVTQVKETVKSNDGGYFQQNRAYHQIQTMGDTLTRFESVLKNGQRDERNQLTKSWTRNLHKLIERHEHEDLMNVKGMRWGLKSKYRHIATLTKESSELETLIALMQSEMMECLTETKKQALARLKMMSVMEKRVAKFKNEVRQKAEEMNRKEMALRKKINLVNQTLALVQRDMPCL